MVRTIKEYRADDRVGGMKLTQSELNAILKDDYISLVLTNCDLDGLRFSRAKLYDSIFDHCTLNRTDFGDADLSLATFRNCIGSETRFDGADMHRTDIDHCTFTYSVFARCVLNGSRVNRSKITNSIFTCAYADMLCDGQTDFNKSSFALSYIDHPSALAIAKNFQYPMACPEEGSFIGWKKCVIKSSGNYYSQECIVKLLIPEDAKRSSATGLKCRCDKAVVLEFQNLAGARLPNNIVAASYHDRAFTYSVGKTVSVDNFDDCRWNECAPGIHFFVSRWSAVDY